MNFVPFPWLLGLGEGSVCVRSHVAGLYLRLESSTAPSLVLQSVLHFLSPLFTSGELFVPSKAFMKEAVC